MMQSDYRPLQIYILLPIHRAHMVFYQATKIPLVP